MALVTGTGARQHPRGPGQGAPQVAPFSHQSLGIMASGDGKHFQICSLQRWKRRGFSLFWHVPSSMSSSQTEASPEQRHQPGAEAGRTQVLKTVIGGSRKAAKQLPQSHLLPDPPVALSTPQKDVYLNTL